MNPDKPDPDLSPYPAPLFLIILILTLSLFPSSLFGQPDPESPAVVAPPTETGKYDELLQFLEKTIAAETETVETLKRRLMEAEAFDQQLSRQVNGYDILLSANSNLLLMPDISQEALERAEAANAEALDAINAYIATVSERLESVIRQQTQTEEQYQLNRKQATAIREDLPESEFRANLIGRLEELLAKIDEKRELLTKIHDLSGRQQTTLTAMREKLSDYSEKIASHIRERRQEKLFSRQNGAALWFGFDRLIGELSDTGSRLSGVISEDITHLQNRIDQHGAAPALAFFLLLLIVILAAIRSRAVLLRPHPDDEVLEKIAFRNVAIRLFADALPVGAAGLFIYIYANVRNIYALFNIFRPAFYLCFLWVCTQWALDILKWHSRCSDKRLAPPLEGRLRRLIRLIRVLSVPMILSSVIFGQNSHLFAWTRFILELSLLIWCIGFWRLVGTLSQEEDTISFRATVTRNVALGLSYGVTGVAIVMEFAGFGALAVHWYTSWGLTIVALIWMWICHHMLRQWAVYIKSGGTAPADGEKRSGDPVRWFLMQLGWLAWLQAGIFFVIFAWRPDKAGILEVYLNIIKYPIAIGGLQFTVFNLLSVIVALSITHAAVSVWKSVLSERMMADSGMEAGLINSITMISGYLLWAVGILISLSIIGVEGDSMAVAFGGLGIGLGFGLQAIFNNFVSGLILLFERPIQVGDVVEVDGLWGEIKKINVRATIVQTYDNATLVIPNSQLVSNSLTNWSFKDLRIRRNIYVGVAYGTDVDLVLNTLREVAENTERVYRYPEPLIYFHDFGDSALIFRMRVWTHIDYCLDADSKIRAGISRRFKDLGIEIAFPQRDIHIRSVPPGSPGATTAEENPLVTKVPIMAEKPERSAERKAHDDSDDLNGPQDKDGADLPANDDSPP